MTHPRAAFEPDGQEQSASGRVVVLSWSTAPREGMEVSPDRAMFGHALDDASIAEAMWQALETSGLRMTESLSERVGVCVTSGLDLAEATAAARTLGVGAVVHGGDESPVETFLDASRRVTDARLDVWLVVGRSGERAAAIALGLERRARYLGWRSLALVGNWPLDAVASNVWSDSVAADLAPLCDAIHGVFQGDRSVCGVPGETEGVAFRSAADPRLRSDSAAFVGLSAPSQASLMALSRAALDRIDGASSLAAIVSDASRRVRFDWRIAVRARSAPQARDDLERRLASASAHRVEGACSVAFVAPSWAVPLAGAVEELYEHEPAFRAALNRCDRTLRGRIPGSLLGLLLPRPGADPGTVPAELSDVLSFVFGYASGECLAAYGVRPAAVLGCGVGELVAAVLVGALSVDQGVLAALDRGRLLAGTFPPCGRVMLQVASDELFERVLRDDGLDVVALPMPDRTVVGGDPVALNQLLAEARDRQWPYQRLPGNPEHTSIVGEQASAFDAGFADVSVCPSTRGWVSAATGNWLSVPPHGHWAATMSGTLHVARGVQRMWDAGCRAFVELAPLPGVVAAGADIIDDQSGFWRAMKVAPEGGTRGVDELLAGLWERGAYVTHPDMPRPPSARGLPTTRWDRSS